MYTIKFGTDGWREIIADHFTTANVRRVASATADYMLRAKLTPLCVVGYDCRFGGEMFARETAAVMASKGIKTILSHHFVSTPMISLAAHQLHAGIGIIITASHNPASYNGFKIKASYGGPATPAVIEEIESLIPAHEVAKPDIDAFIQSGMVETADMEELYKRHVESSFDMPALHAMSEHLVYDAMYGAGQNIVRSLFPKTHFLHASFNPSFDGRAPEPILKNLPEITAQIKTDANLFCGLATDGDADRIGFFDENGNFVDSHNLILLLVEYLTEYKGLSGKVVKSFSVSDRVQKLCDLKGIETITTKIGFKYICELMVTDDVLVGAEESGGIAIKGHLPERDGVWMGLVLMEYMAVTGKKVSELLEDIYKQTGTFAVERYDLHITEDLKQSIIAQCKSGAYSAFGPLNVVKTEDTDGFKFRFDNDRWVMIRPSGTEPVLRVYAEAESSAKAFEILDIVKSQILK